MPQLRGGGISHVLLERLKTRKLRRAIAGGAVGAGRMGDALMVAVTLDNVTISYDRHPAVHHVSGRFASGSLTAIAGPNGAGKSTLLKAIAGLLPLDEGRILFASDLLCSPLEGEQTKTSHAVVKRRRTMFESWGVKKKTPFPPTLQAAPAACLQPLPLKEVAKGTRFAYMPQASEIQRDFPLTVLHMVAAGAWHEIRAFGAITKATRERAAKALADVGLNGFEHRNLPALSMGQFQRALFARLMMQDAPLILLDEPFAAIDADTTAHLLDIILRWHGDGRTVICVLHDFAQIRQYFPECLLLARECIAWGESAQVLTPEYMLNTRFFHGDWKPAPEACERAV